MCLIDVEGSTFYIFAIQVGDCFGGVCISCHIYEPKASRLARIAVRHDIHTLHVAVLGKRGMQFILRGLEAEISDKDIHLGVAPFGISNCLCQTAVDARAKTFLLYH